MAFAMSMTSTRIGGPVSVRKTSSVSPLSPGKVRAFSSVCLTTYTISYCPRPSMPGETTTLMRANVVFTYPPSHNITHCIYFPSIHSQALLSLPRRVSRASSSSPLTVRAAATYICVDCGYLYDEPTAFAKLPNNYKCPVCSSPKRRFKAYSGGNKKNDPKSMKNRMVELQSSATSVAADDGGSNNLVLIGGGGAVLLAALYFGLSGYFN